MTLTETCSCGASITIAASTVWPSEMTAWRDGHRHEPRIAANELTRDHTLCDCGQPWTDHRPGDAT